MRQPLQTAEAALTGESLPVTKDIDAIAEEIELGDRHNMIFSGTSVTSGRGHAVVVATGMQTEMGRIAGMLEETPTGDDAAAEGARSRRKTAGRDRRRHRGGDDRDNSSWSRT